MKRIISFVFVLMLTLSSCMADGRKEVVTIGDIPSAAQQVLSSFFPDIKVAAVIRETELFETE